MHANSHSKAESLWMYSKATSSTRLHLKIAKYLKFEVHDTGIGIDEKEIPKLFRLFGKLNKDYCNLNSRGTGLGLAISKRIVESLGGSIHLKFIK